MGPSAAKALFFFCSILLAGLVIVRGTAEAQSITGYVELSQANTDSETKDAASGQTSNTKSQNFLQRYSVVYRQSMFPYLDLRAGINVDKTIATVQSPEGDFRATGTRYFPSADLTLKNPLVQGGVGISRREEKVESGGTSVTNYQDRKTAFLGWRPAGLPSLEVHAERTHTFDATHQVTDSEFDLYSASMLYTPVSALDLAYTALLRNGKNNLNGSTSDLLSQTGRAAYNERFFDNRVVLSINANGTRSKTESQSGSSSEVFLPLFPFGGLSSISLTPTLDTLSPNPALIDGNQTASSGVNIGQGLSLSGDTRLRSVGLDFVNVTGVNTLEIYVDRQLPASAASTVAWDVYVSSDNQNWVLFQTNLHGAFDPFTNRFELLFPDVSTRYIKAATRPLAITVLPTPGTNINNVFITELQSFFRTPSAQATSTTEFTSQRYDTNLRTAILENQLLTYSFYYSLTRTSGSPDTALLSNALSSLIQFSKVFSGTARVSRDDTSDAFGRGVAYTGTASLAAVPLPTLYHSLVLSVRKQDVSGATDESTRSESVVLNNTASVYEGFSVNLSVGANSFWSASRGTTDSTFLNAGASIAPHKSLTMTITTVESQANLPNGTVNRTVNTSGAITWVPISPLYLAYSISKVSQTGLPDQTLQTYNTSWSPFSSGTLNITAGYSENWQEPAGTRDEALSAGMTWRAGPKMWLTAGYANTKSSDSNQTTYGKSFTVELRVTF